MKKYRGFIRCGFLEGCAYRSVLLTGMLANFIQTAVLYYMWKSIFAYQPVVSGYTWEIMRKYVFVSFLCNSALSLRFEMDTAKKIIRGDIILDFLKPASYRSMLFFRLTGNAVVEFGITLIFTGTLYLCVNGTEGLSVVRTLLFLVSMLCGQGIKFCIQYLFSMLCFYTDNAYGVSKAREVLTNFFSGAIIPVVMFPEFCREIVVWLPFQGIVFTPCSIFIGTYSIAEVVRGIGMQVVWIVILSLCGSLLWKKATSVISLYGG